MSVPNEKACDLANPFMKRDDTNAPIVLSDKYLRNKTFSANGINKKTMKQQILPFMIDAYKAKFSRFNDANEYIMNIVYFSNHFKQFQGIYLNKGVYPSLVQINDIITKKYETKGKEVKKVGVESLQSDMVKAENTYFEKNKEYKSGIAEVVKYLNKEYISDFKKYYDFELSTLLLQRKELESYKAYIESKRNEILRSTDEEVKIKIENELKKKYASLISILPSSIVEELPQSIKKIQEELLNPISNPKETKQDEYKGGEKKNKRIGNNYPYEVRIPKSTSKSPLNLQVRGRQQDIFKSQNPLDNAITKINKSIQTYKNTKEFILKNKESEYMMILEHLNEILRVESAEMSAFQELQKVRAQSNPEKLQKQYELYDNIVKKRVVAHAKLDFDTLESTIGFTSNNFNERIEIKKITGGATSENKLKVLYNELKTKKSKLIRPSIFELKTLFDQYNQELLKVFKTTNNGPNKPSLQEGKSLNDLFNYFRMVNEKNGVDDIILDDLRSKDIPRIREFLSNFKDQLEGEVSLFKKRVEAFQSLKEDAEGELTILKDQKARSNTNSSAQASKLADLRREKSTLEGEIKELNKKIDIADEQINKWKYLEDDNFKLTGLLITINKIPNHIYRIYAEKIKKINILNFDEREEKLNNYLDSLKLINVSEKDNIKTNILNIFEYKSFSPKSTTIILPHKADLEKIKTEISTIINSISSDITNNNELNTFKSTIIDKLNEKLYERLLEEDVTNDSGFKPFLMDMKSLGQTIKSKEGNETDKNNKQKELTEINRQISEITQGPEEVTRLFNAKSTFVTTITKNLENLEKIITEKTTHNEKILEIASKFLPTLTEMYSALIQREQYRKKLGLQSSIENNVYYLFVNDPLYKIMKSITELNGDFTNPAKSPTNTNDKKIAIIKEIATYLKTRFEKIPPFQESNGNTLESKQYLVSTLASTLKGQKVGNISIPATVNMNKVTKEITNEQNLDEILGYVKNIQNGKPINSIHPNRVEYLKNKYAHLIMGGGESEGASQLIHLNNVPKNISSTYFMESIYASLLENKGNNESIYMFVKNLKEFDYDLMKRIKAQFDIAMRSPNISGSNKLPKKTITTGTETAVQDNILQQLIYTMAKINLVDDIQTKLTDFTKRGLSSKELINIYFIQKYLYMEIILMYFMIYLRDKK